MIKNFVLTVSVVLILVVLSPQIKAGVLEARMAMSMSQIDMTESTSDALDSAVDRVADGYRQQVFSTLELTTVQSLMIEIRSYQGKALSEAEGSKLSGQLEVILRRHGL